MQPSTVCVRRSRTQSIPCTLTGQQNYNKGLTTTTSLHNYVQTVFFGEVGREEVVRGISLGKLPPHYYSFAS